VSVIRDLGSAAERWVNLSSDSLREAVLALSVSTGLSEPLVRRALQNAFGELTTEKLTSFVDQEPAFQSGACRGERHLHIAAGNVFTAWLPSAVTTLLLGADCWIKPSVRETVLAPLWQKTVHAINPVLGQRIVIKPWNPDLLKQVDAVIAYGSDETVADLNRQCPPATRFVAYGHKLSVAIVLREALSRGPALVQDLLEDLTPFQMQGCLTPQVVYVEGDAGELAAKVAEKTRHQPAYKSFSKLADLEADLGALRPYLSGAGLAGPADRTAALEPILTHLGVTRICRLGSLQRPPLTWRNGGFSLAEALTRD
jgi:hypothetical protein